MGPDDLNPERTPAPGPDDAAPASDPSATADYVPYDFQRPTTLAREHARILDVAFETFTRQWSSQMTTRLRVKTKVTPVHVALATYDAYTSSLPTTTCLLLLQFDGLENRGVLQMPVDTAADWVSRMLGSGGETTLRQRGLTATEVGVLRRAMIGVMEDLSYSFTGVLDCTPIPEASVQYNPGFVQAAAPTDLMIVGVFDATTGAGTAERFTLAMPSEAILPRLGSSNPVDTDQDGPRLAMEQLAATPMEVRLEATSRRINSMDVLRLSVGDIVPLTHTSNRPFSLTVGGRRLATAVDVVDGSRKYMKIVDTELEP